jgi:hypothetical protein
MGVTTPEMTDDLMLEDGETPVGAAYTAGLDAVARLHDDALDGIARLAETWDSPADEVRVLRLAERPMVTQRAEAAAA